MLQPLAPAALQPTQALLTQKAFDGSAVQEPFAVQATHRPLFVAQAGVPARATQSLSPVHFAHLLAKHSGLGAGQSVSTRQLPGASGVACGARS